MLAKFISRITTHKSHLFNPKRSNFVIFFFFILGLVLRILFYLSSFVAFHLYLFSASNHNLLYFFVRLFFYTSHNMTSCSFTIYSILLYYFFLQFCFGRICCFYLKLLCILTTFFCNIYFTFTWIFAF
uniref:Uncharacterized protein n=1 Tax=Cacopsylla melanoneura TaxID=428564 RepID=A0A8D8VFU1_9HEMI